MPLIAGICGVFSLLMVVAEALTVPEVCQSRKFGYKIQDPEDCHGFYVCLGNWGQYNLNCGAGYRFDEGLQKCMKGKCPPCPCLNSFIESGAEATGYIPAVPLILLQSTDKETEDMNNDINSTTNTANQIFNYSNTTKVLMGRLRNLVPISELSNGLPSEAQLTIEPFTNTEAISEATSSPTLHATQFEDQRQLPAESRTDTAEFSIFSTSSDSTSQKQPMDYTTRTPAESTTQIIVTEIKTLQKTSIASITKSLKTEILPITPATAKLPTEHQTEMLMETTTYYTTKPKTHTMQLTGKTATNTITEATSRLLRWTTPPEISSNTSTEHTTQSRSTNIIESTTQTTAEITMSAITKLKEGFTTSTPLLTETNVEFPTELSAEYAATQMPATITDPSIQTTKLPIETTTETSVATATEIPTESSSDMWTENSTERKNAITTPFPSATENIRSITAFPVKTISASTISITTESPTETTTEATTQPSTVFLIEATTHLKAEFITEISSRNIPTTIAESATDATTLPTTRHAETEMTSEGTVRSRLRTTEAATCLTSTSATSEMATETAMLATPTQTDNEESTETTSLLTTQPTVKTRPKFRPSVTTRPPSQPTTTTTLSTAKCTKATTRTSIPCKTQTKTTLTTTTLTKATLIAFQKRQQQHHMQLEIKEDLTDVNSVCAQHNGVHFIKHPKQCNKYYSCYKKKAYPQVCPGRFFFDDKLKMCNHREAVDCSIENTHSNAKMQHFALGGNDLKPDDCSRLKSGTFIRDAKNCNKYYVCLNGYAVALYCPRGQYFDIEGYVCNFKGLVKNCLA